MRNRVSIVYLVDSAGVNLPLQDGIFPGQYGAARIFYYNSLMRRRMRIPQIAGFRGYSMINHPGSSSKAKFIIKRKPDGAFTEWLFSHAQPGDAVEWFDDQPPAIIESRALLADRTTLETVEAVPFHPRFDRAFVVLMENVVRKLNVAVRAVQFEDVVRRRRCLSVQLSELDQEPDSDQ